MVQVITYDVEQRRRHKWRNLLHSTALLVMIFGILTLCAWLFAGWTGVFMSAALSISLLFFAGRFSPRLVFAIYSAREIPLETFPEGYAILRTLTQRAKLSELPRLHYIPSLLPTAFTVGRLSNAHIAVSEGLLRLLGTQEFTAILAHEVSHIRNRDLTVMALADLAARTTHFFGRAGLLLLAFSVPAWFATYGYIPWAQGLVLFVAPLLSNLLQLGLSRSREFDADLDAASLTQDPAALASALDKMEQQEQGLLQRLVLGNRKNAIPSILRTHPPTRERIDRLLSLYKIESFKPTELEQLILPESFVRSRNAPRRHRSGLRW